jgi:hypothetical protein
VIDSLLSSKVAYAEHWLTFWNDLLRNDYAGTGYIDGGRRQISAWLYEALLSNMPFDQFTRELIARTRAAGLLVASSGGAKSVPARPWKSSLRKVWPKRFWD